MKEITKQIRQAVKEKIEEVGGVQNLLNMHHAQLNDKFLGNYSNKRDNYYYEVLTAIDNQIDYFRYKK